MSSERGGSSRYEQIAIDLAERIVKGEYREGAKIFGRSTLAGTYQVSPETIRRAIALLHSRGVLTAEAGRGIVVDSVNNARQFLDEVQAKERIVSLRARIDELMAQRDRINAEIEELLRELVDFASKTISTVQHISDFVINERSPLVGQTLASSQIRFRTGATVIAVGKQGEDVYSPSADLVLQPSDVLVVVGPPEAKEKLRELVEGTSGG